MKEENDKIEETMNYFAKFEDNIDSLNNDMKNIISSTNDVVKFNETIMNHVEQLSASSEEVTNCTEEALTISEENRKKTIDTKAIMDKLLVISSQFDKHIN